MPLQLVRVLSARSATTASHSSGAERAFGPLIRRAELRHRNGLSDVLDMSTKWRDSELVRAPAKPDPHAALARLLRPNKSPC
jgi:hypothetical protein